MFAAKKTVTARVVSRAGRLFSAAAGKKYDVVVIGGGPGGYVAAIKGAQIGLKVACVEMDNVGGTCLNRGCIPSKALLNATHHYTAAKHHFKDFGILGGESLTVDYSKLHDQKTATVTGLVKGVEGLFKTNKVDHFKGMGKLAGKNSVSVTRADGTVETIETENILIATGSVPFVPPQITIDEKIICTSTGALNLEKIPESMVVIGGGVIGLELGSVYQRLGTKVTVVDHNDRCTPSLDVDIGKAFQKALEKQQFNFEFGQKVDSVVNKGTSATVTVTAHKDGTQKSIDADVVLVSTGRRPYTDGLGLDVLGIQTDDRARVKIDSHFRTNVPNVYAIGDVVAGPMLAHKAEEEGIAAVEIMAGKHGHVNYDAIPGVIYTHPEVASVGKTEAELKAAGVEYKTGKFTFMANSRARANQDTEGLVKVITDAKTDRILGGHIIGASAGELIGELVLAMEYGAASEDVARTCHAHPTLSEAVKEACLAAHGKPIHS
jgi:dihydrolipoamide dehydrogenase